MASYLEYWSQFLLDEMKAQNIELYPKQDLRDLTGDSNMDFTLRRDDARNLVITMRERIAEIRRLEK